MPPCHNFLLVKRKCSVARAYVTRMYFARHIRWSDANPTLLKDNSFVPGVCSGACLPRALHQLLSVCLLRCFWRNKLTRQVKNSYSVDLEHCISDNAASSYSLLQQDMKTAYHSQQTLAQLLILIPWAATEKSVRSTRWEHTWAAQHNPHGHKLSFWGKLSTLTSHLMSLRRV